MTKKNSKLQKIESKVNKVSGIYCIENLENNKKYIGFSSNIKRRWEYHKCFLNNNNHDNQYLQASRNKYGMKNFIFYILEECEKEKLEEREIFYIKKYKTKNRDFGYNLSDGGSGNFGWIPSEETRIKKSISVSGDKNLMYGRKHSLETKLLFSAQRTGTKNGVGNTNNLGLVKKYKNSTSVYYGVFKYIYRYKGKEKIKWYSRISKNGKDIKIGVFEKEIDAAKAWDKKSWEFHKDLNKLNFPEDYYGIEYDKEVYDYASQNIFGGNK